MRKCMLLLISLAKLSKKPAFAPVIPFKLRTRTTTAVVITVLPMRMVAVVRDNIELCRKAYLQATRMPSFHMS